MDNKLVDFVLWGALIFFGYAIWRLWTIDWEDDNNRVINPVASACRNKSEFKDQYPVKLEYEIPSADKACIAVGICDEVTLGYYYDSKLVHGWKEDLIVSAEKIFGSKKSLISKKQTKRKRTGSKK